MRRLNKLRLLSGITAAATMAIGIGMVMVPNAMAAQSGSGNHLASDQALVQHITMIQPAISQARDLGENQVFRQASLRSISIGSVHDVGPLKMQTNLGYLLDNAAGMYRAKATTVSFSLDFDEQPAVIAMATFESGLNNVDRARTVAATMKTLRLGNYLDRGQLFTNMQTASLIVMDITAAGLKTGARTTL